MIPEKHSELDLAVKMFVHMHNNRDPFVRILALREYFAEWEIKKVVVGVSGGVDSALVLFMLAHIPEIEVHAVTIDFADYCDVFDNSFVEELRKSASRFKNIVWHHRDLTESHDRFIENLELVSSSLEVQANSSYAMRYLAFFAIAQSIGGVTIGTTNLDEMEYVGWFGKNSDMVVDVQPISDLYKFEVVTWARLLGVPERIANRVPTGDLIDGTSDEENFGCTYDELSYYTNLRKNNPGLVLPPFIKAKFAEVERLRRKNAHKYQGQTFNPVFIRG